MIEKDEILSAIKRLASAGGGKPPGVRAFTSETGISQGQWYGVHWARWSDALADAGFGPNEKQGKFDSEAVLKSVGSFALELGRMPTNPEMKMRRRSDLSFPNPKTVASHFGSISDLRSSLRALGGEDPAFQGLLEIISASEAGQVSPSNRTKSDRWVYLLKSGANFKIGRGEQLERRVKQIATAMPDSTVLEHAIRTDDPAGIEAYWHRRFAGKRLNGEWFKLDAADVAAFKRRKFQ